MITVSSEISVSSIKCEGTYVWCHSLKMWARMKDRLQGGCFSTTSRYSSAISHTGGLRPSNRAGLWRFPSVNVVSSYCSITALRNIKEWAFLYKHVYESCLCMRYLRSWLLVLQPPPCSAEHHSGAGCFHWRKRECLQPPYTNTIKGTPLGQNTKNSRHW